MRTVWMCVVLLLTPAVGRAEPLTLTVWPGKAPGEDGSVGPEKVERGKPGEKRPVTRIGNVTEPTLTVFRPDKAKDTGAAVVICPGGGYNILAWDLEGEEVAAWLNSVGVTGVVLKYRVPRRKGTPGDVPPPQALEDVQRAMSLVRSKAAEWNLDPQRIGILGFSAGGHLAAWASTNYDRRAYDPVDAVDKESGRPDFTVLIYPAYLVTKDRGRLVDAIRVTKDTPPAFLAHAGNDPVPADSSVQYYLALRKAGVPAELHVYTTGGHGFGLRPTAEPSTSWPQRCADWMRVRGLLDKRGAEAP